MPLRVMRARPKCRAAHRKSDSRCDGGTDDAFENWIIKVQMSDASELDDLMDASAYKAFIKE